MESLRRLILGASHIDSKRLFDRKKQRFGAAFKLFRAFLTFSSRYDRMVGRSKVDKAIGTETEFSEEDIFDRSSSRHKTFLLLLPIFSFQVQHELREL